MDNLTLDIQVYTHAPRRECFAAVEPQIPFDNYIIDFVWSAERRSVLVLEVCFHISD
jgi:hypothetical protein